MPDEHLPPYPSFGSFATPVTSTVSSYFDPYAAGPSHTAPNLHAYPPLGMSPHDPYYPSHMPLSTTEFRLTFVEIQLGIVFRHLHELSAQQSASGAPASAAPSSSPLPPLPTSSPPPPPPLPSSPPRPSPPAPLFPSHHALPPSIEGHVSALEEDMAYVRGVIDASTPPRPPPL
ncbi:vegetative cell wall protein gp1-like [Helianthus annuus]|uniref:vegetative cell wall protein gp1-like n=1 Tax=Helianthus annuus TaxID=4232 RepID=UPI000B8FE15D|nr:vegetative cell wall protein gp1-like [Helianthus annuus]